jgi:hypothetical protein
VELKAFAQKIIDAQKTEIKMMQDFLKREIKNNLLLFSRYALFAYFIYF